MAKLLVIDDDPDFLDLLRHRLSGKYECHMADSAEQALECLEIQQYDLILTDVFMPGLSGLEILKLTKRRSPSTPVIVISARGHEFQEFFKAMGAFECLTKPICLETLELVITGAIAQLEKGT